MVKYCRVKCNNDEFSVKPSRLVLVVKKQSGASDDEGAWQSNDGDLELRWDKGDGSPWGVAFHQIARGAAGRNLGAPTGAAGRYRYTLKITVPGQTPITIDPEVVVSEGGPPNGHKKKTAKKKAAKKKK